MADIPEPTEAIRFLEQKNRVPTEAWDDLKWGEHAHGFTVAHSVEADILDTLHGSLNDAIKNGEAYGSWRKKALAMMHEKGWYGGNGHTVGDKKYISWRLRIIYDTNMRTAYSAAQYRKQLQGAEGRPIWVYKSKLAGKNRRQEHIALHNKAFRFNDPFWNTYYPPNGWGCQCSVTTKSIAGAERDGITVLESGPDGKPPPLNGIDWDTFGDPTWQYNPGREALAPNFAKYGNLPETVITEAQERYRQDMDNTRLTEGEFKILIRRIQESDYTPLNILYTAGNLDAKRFEKVREKGVTDSKIMATDYDLWHGTGDPDSKHPVQEEFFDELYTLLQKPESIYGEIPSSNEPYTVFYFTKETRDGKKIRIRMYHLELQDGTTALKVLSIEHVTYEHDPKKHEKIW
jgi:hypothetical protein